MADRLAPLEGVEERLRGWTARAARFFNGMRREGGVFAFDHPVQVRGKGGKVLRVVDVTDTNIVVEVDGTTKYARLYDVP